MVKVAVIGCGLMGCKIAGELAYHGHRVKMHDVDMVVLNSVYQRLSQDKEDLIREGLLLQNAFPGHILCMSRIEETVQDAEFVFEAVIDDLEVKRDLFETIHKYTKPTAILATNTLRLKVDDIVTNITNKERGIGLRFLYPVYAIPEVEITPGSDTSQSTIARVRDLLEKMGKTLFFRSGTEPLILTEDQREERKRQRQVQILNMSNFGRPTCVLPTLSSSASNLSTRMPPSNNASFNSSSGLSHRDSMSSTYNAIECAICLDNPRDCVLEPCRHFLLCKLCANLLHSRQDYCPICRRQITEVSVIFLA